MCTFIDFPKEIVLGPHPSEMLWAVCNTEERESKPTVIYQWLIQLCYVDLLKSYHLKWQSYLELPHPYPGPNNRAKSSSFVLANHFPSAKVIFEISKLDNWIAFSLMSLLWYNSKQTMNKLNNKVTLSVWKTLFFENSF